MKRLFLIAPLLILLFASCEVYIEEPVIIHDDRDHFTGPYLVEEYDLSSNVYTEYNINIVKSGRYRNSVWIENFFGVGIDVLADVRGYDIFIPDQEVNGYRIDGSGYLENGELILNYRVYDQLNSHGHAHLYEAVAW